MRRARHLSMGAVLLVLASAIRADAPDARPLTGLNLERIDGRWLLFNDVVQTAAHKTVSPESTWEARDAKSLAPVPIAIPLDANGYPSVPLPHDGAVARADLLVGNRWAPRGTYRLTFAGTGTIRVAGDAETRECSGTQPTCDVVVRPSGAGIQLYVLSSSATDRITSISLTVPGASGVFYAPTLAQLRGVDAIRSMNATWVNHYPCSNEVASDAPTCVQTWAARQPPTAIQSRRAGLAWEHLFALCNAVAADCWATIPHAADDDYVRQLAELAERTLAPGNRFVPELSNELWNGHFAQSRYFAAVGQRTQTGSPAERRRKAIVVRVAQVLATTRAVFADDARLYAPIGGFAFNGEESAGLLSLWNDPAYNPSQQRLDALAIAPYFGGQSFAHFAKQCPPRCPTEAELLVRVRADLDALLPGYLSTQARVAREAGVDLVAYEGGTLIIGEPPDPPLVRIADAAVRQPAAGALIDRYYEIWNAAGGTLFVHFGWVHAESAFGQMLIPGATDAPPTPMWDALRRRVDAGPP